MKPIYILATVFLFTCFNINAQTTDVVTGLTPVSLLIIGDDLYFSNESGGDIKISKIDVTSTTPSVTDIVTVTNVPTGLALNNNDLYICEFGDSSQSKISKIDITATTPELTEIITGLNGPVQLAIYGNDLYISLLMALGISKIDITSPTPTVTSVINGLPTFLLMINNNDLYFSQSYDGASYQISKIDITSPTPTIVDVVTEPSFYLGFSLHGNDLYFSDHTGNKISKIDITEATPTVTDVVTGLNGPFGIAIHGEDLYIAENGANKISKFSLTTLSITENTLKKKVTLFPNPSTNSLQIVNLDKTEKYEIYSSIGQKIDNGIISNNEKIDIKNLTSGLYFLKFDNGNTIKFIKE